METLDYNNFLTFCCTKKFKQYLDIKDIKKIKEKESKSDFNFLEELDGSKNIQESKTLGKPVIYSIRRNLKVFNPE